MVDILNVSDNRVNIYEVKSSTEVKDIYLHDVSIQYYVLKNLGFTINSANVLHINSDYEREEQLELDKLFKIVDVTNEVEALQQNIPIILEELRDVLHDKDNEPNIEIGKQCHKPYVCDAKEYCWRVQRDISEYSIFSIFNLGSKKQVELYEQGIVNIDDISDDFVMTPNQATAVTSFKSKTSFIDKQEISNFLQNTPYTT